MTTKYCILLKFRLYFWREKLSVHVRMGSSTGFSGSNLTFPYHSSDDGRLVIFILAQLGCRLLITVILLINSNSAIFMITQRGLP